MERIIFWTVAVFGLFLIANNGKVRGVETSYVNKVPLAAVEVTDEALEALRLHVKEGRSQNLYPRR